MIKEAKIGEVRVTLDFADCPDDGGKYMLICSDHSFIIQDNNKTALWKHRFDVKEWCEACAGNDPRYQEAM